MSDLKEKAINDATDKVKGFLYQFYTALKYCFELSPGEKLYIEKYGDITIQGLLQIEVKKYSNPLTDTQDNFWNTLYNWCIQSFNPKEYKHLILLTTQQIGKKSKLFGWNDKTTNEKIKIIVEIATDYSKKNTDSTSKPIIAKINQMSFIMTEDNKIKLLDILGKFSIIDCALGYEDIFENVKNLYTKDIPEDKQEMYLNGLLGYIINPNTVVNNWEISYENFVAQAQKLTSLYHAGTVVFPRIKNPTVEEINKKNTSRFVEKLKEIEYEIVKDKAIFDFLTTNNLLINDFSVYTINPKIIEDYETELLGSFEPRKRCYQRKILQYSNKQEIINESQNFYDDIIGESAQPFLNYNDTPKSFRNGFYHIMADDAENIDKIVWLLKDKEFKNDKKN